MPMEQHNDVAVLGNCCIVGIRVVDVDSEMALGACV